MTERKFKYLIVITTALFLLAFVSFLIQPRYETSFESGSVIFDNVENKLNNIKEIKIDNGKKVILIEKKDNSWYMTSKNSYKVKNEEVRKNLIQISELRFFEKKTKEEFLYSRLDLDYPNDEDGESKLISINNNDKENILEFILGKRKKNGVYIKSLNDKQTWLTSGIVDMSSIEQDWLETKILDISYEDINKISLSHSKPDNSFSLSKDEKNENLLINNLTKDQLPKSDLIANFIGYFLTNLIFEDVSKRKVANENNIINKIDFETSINNISNNISITVFKVNKDKWINIDVNDYANKEYLFVENVNNWSYKLPSTKYSVAETKLKDLLVED